MSEKQLDVLFISPNNASEIYQELSNDYSGIEPPTWALILSQSVRSKGFSVAILDTLAENLTDDQSIERIKLLNPRLLCLVVYGQNVNAGTVGMSGAVRLSNKIKKEIPNSTISFVGSYVQGLPIKTLKDEPSIDIVFCNEGAISLWNLLSLSNFNDLSSINGIAWRKNGKPTFNAPEKVVQDLDKDFNGYAFDLLPYKEKPLDLYRSPLWHSGYNINKRTPYAAIQTSIGCRFSCEFCVINIVNRNDNEEIGVAGNYSGMRYWSPEFIIKEFDKLVDMGVYTIKITDELFLFDKRYYVPLCKLLKERGYGDKLSLWIYSRVDTVANPELLSLVRDAGVKFIALGIESGNRNVRLEVSKGKFQDVDIKKVVDQIHDAGIEVMANYIFGLPNETMESMRQTLDLSIDLCTSGWNGYAAMNLPSSKLYADAVKKGIRLPDTYSGYSFHSYNTVCNSTDSLTAAQILKFRDDAFIEYHTNEKFLNRILRIYGQKEVDNIKEMCKIKLKRKIVEEAGLY